VGLGRKASGSYYTPHPFVRFLVQETLGVLLAECSPRENPQPALILRLKVLDSAMGSGHFLVEACRFLGEGLYEACRLCDELAVQAEEQAEKVEGAERELLLSRAADLRRRVEDLPDPNNELLAYLPSRAAEGEESGLSQKKAEAMCRRLVAVHCLYGVDKNPLAVELAKLSLWLESYAEGLPLTFLDHRLICGDSLTGPFFEHLLTYPKSGGRLDDLFAQGLTQRLQDTLAAALVHVRDLEASVGKDLADLHLKESAKAKLDAALAPLKTLAAAWSGGVMLGDDCDDAAYQLLAEAVASGKPLEHEQGKRDTLGRMVETGYTSVPYQLIFPEVFFRSDARAGGFDAVLGNPPWDKPIIEPKSFFSEYLPWILDGKGKAEWEVHAKQLLGESEQIAARFEVYQRQQVAPALVRAKIDSKINNTNSFSGGHPEMFALFIDKAISELASSSRGSVAFVVGGGLISNASSEKARAQILLDAFPRYIYQFDNRKSLFVDLPPILEFCIFVCDRKPRQEGLRYALRLDEYEDIYGDKVRLVDASEIKAAASNRFILGGSAAGATSDSFLTALRDHMGIVLTAEADPAKTDHHARIADILGDATADARQQHVVAQLNSLGYLPFRTSPSIYLYDDSPPQRHSRWSPFLTSAVSIHDPLISRSLKAVCHYRLTVRRKCGSPKSNERSLISAVIPPGYICSNNLMSERLPSARPSYMALVAEAVWNSFTPDSNARRIISTTFGLTQMSAVGFPELSREILGFLAHGALRLNCNHSGYADLWKEQLGDAWRESNDNCSWPVLASEYERLQVISTIDAVVAQCYGISRSTYEQVLDGFEHRRHPQLPLLCLQVFDELMSIGIDSFRRKHDPYWDVCLNEALPQPSIDLPGNACEASSSGGLGPLFESLTVQALPVEPRPTTFSSSAAETSVVTAPPVRPSSNGAFATIGELLRSRGVITSSDAQQATGLDAAGVRPHLQRLVSEGMAVTEGQRRGMKYRRVDG
jgi:hypothetical protein